MKSLCHWPLCLGLILLSLLGHSGCGKPAASTVSATSGQSPAKKSQKELLVGTWEVVQAEPEDANARGSAMEFTAEGKVTVHPKNSEPQTYTYRLDGAKLVITLPIEAGEKAQEDVSTITTLTESELVLTKVEGSDKGFAKLKRK